jgi:hypothetical protein
MVYPLPLPVLNKRAGRGEKEPIVAGGIL